MAIEDAACLGIVFGEKHFNGDISECLQTYERVRMPRATRVQAAAAKARENINERIGKTGNIKTPSKANFLGSRLLE
jgi:salicylate hydroxylase